MNHKNYSKNYRCPICWQPITNKARFCRVHAKEFRDWLAEIYEKSVRVPKRKGPGGAKARGERRRCEILDLLKFGSLTTRELATEFGVSRDNILHHAHMLEKSGDVEREKDGHSVTWRKVRI